MSKTAQMKQSSPFIFYEADYQVEFMSFIFIFVLNVDK